MRRKSLLYRTTTSTVFLFSLSYIYSQAEYATWPLSCHSQARTWHAQYTRCTVWTSIVNTQAVTLSKEFVSGLRWPGTYAAFSGLGDSSSVMFLGSFQASATYFV
jgi:hypothetical protein